MIGSRVNDDFVVVSNLEHEEMHAGVSVRTNGGQTALPRVVFTVSEGLFDLTNQYVMY